MKIRVLFARDSQIALSIYKTEIEHLGWEGLYVSDAEQLMKCVNQTLTQEKYLDAVVADIAYSDNGSKLTGITAAREIRKSMPLIPIILLSDYTNSIIREEARRVDAELIQKPVDPKNVLAQLSKLIDRDNRITTGHVLVMPERIKQTLDNFREEK